jgi:hypothetical protein
MSEFSAAGTIASVAPTVAELFGGELPSGSREPALSSVSDYRSTQLGTAPTERCLVFCPDALGVHIWEACPQLQAEVSARASHRVSVLSVFPPKTPVCFASMFSGAQPIDHGIRKFERPVLKYETLFDALIRAGKPIAVVAVRDSSVDLIFRERAMEYFSEDYDAQVLERALQLLTENRHDLVIVYQQEYDDLLHRTEPFSEPCRQAASHHVESFCRLADATAAAWGEVNHALVFAPDHGAHVDPASGHGDHGEDIPEDMRLFHWYDIRAGRIAHR